MGPGASPQTLSSIRNEFGSTGRLAPWTLITNRASQPWGERFWHGLLAALLVIICPADAFPAKLTIQSKSIVSQRSAMTEVTAGSLLPPATATRSTTRELAYLDMPTVSATTLVFSCEGDLWSVPIDGGIAHRITRHPGEEGPAHISPDGNTIAFTAQYHGNLEAYTMPVEGGVPTRLTDHPEDDLVTGWRPDGSAVIVSSPRGSPNNIHRLWEAPIQGGPATLLPVGEAQLIAYSPDGRRAVFNRALRNPRVWKRYRGGLPIGLWWADLTTGRFRRLTDSSFRGSEAYPVWLGDRIYFASDRDGIMNVWSVKEDGSDLHQHTHHEGFEVRSLCGRGRRVVYACGADLFALDVKTDTTSRIPIRVFSERPDTMRRYVDPCSFLEDPCVSVDGRRVTFPIRGDLFLAAPDLKDSRVINLTETPGVRERIPAISPDGKRVACVSDASGEERITLLSTDGSGSSTDVTTALRKRYSRLVWSPDAQRLAFSDQTMTLNVVDVKTRSIRTIDRTTSGEIDDYSWSPDSAWLAYAKPEENGMSTIFINEVAAGRSHRVTEGDASCHSPAWDPGGKYLYFLSDRTLSPYYDSMEFGAFFSATCRPYLLLLSENTRSPFQPTDVDNEDSSTEKRTPSGVQNSGKKGEAREDKGATHNTKTPSSPAPASVSPAKPTSAPITPSKTTTSQIEITLRDIDRRIVELPVAQGNYNDLAAGNGKIYFTADQKTLMVFDLTSRETRTLEDNITSFVLPIGGKKLVFRRGSDVQVVDLADEKNRKSVAVARIPVRVVPPLEWAQIFREAWRLQREFYWAPNMAGIDWDDVYRRYVRLLPRIATRSALNDLIGQMFGELATSHTYVSGGDIPGVASVSMGLLGADLAQDRKSGLWKIVRVLRGYEWLEADRSPLAVSSARVKDGQYIRALNRRPITAAESLNLRLEALTDVPVLLSVSETPTSTAREVVVKPLSSEQQLRYHDWVRSNRERVGRETGGRCGYVHIPDMYSEGYSEFARGFYPAIRKRALIVDARYNRGGNVSQLIIQKLQRVLYGLTIERLGHIRTFPNEVLNGHLIWLTNGHAGSDGDIGPASFQKLKLGPVLGTRTWGGTIGIRGSPFLFVDGGSSTQPYSASWMLEHGWQIENRGVQPDIPVDNEPSDQAAGRDTQLIRAIEYIKESLKKDPRDLPVPPPWPDKSLDHFRKQER